MSGGFCLGVLSWGVFVWGFCRGYMSRGFSSGGSVLEPPKINARHLIWCSLKATVFRQSIFCVLILQLGIKQLIGLLFSAEAQIQCGDITETSATDWVRHTNCGRMNFSTIVKPNYPNSEGTWKLVQIIRSSVDRGLQDFIETMIFYILHWHPFGRFKYCFKSNWNSFKPVTILQQSTQTCDFAPIDHRETRWKVLQNFAGPFQTPWLGFWGGAVDRGKQTEGLSSPCHKLYIYLPTFPDIKTGFNKFKHIIGKG